jgi:hypothetical protein
MCVKKDQNRTNCEKTGELTHTTPTNSCIQLYDCILVSFQFLSCIEDISEYLLFHFHSCISLANLSVTWFMSFFTRLQTHKTSKYTFPSSLLALYSNSYIETREETFKQKFIFQIINMCL